MRNLWFFVAGAGLLLIDRITKIIALNYSHIVNSGAFLGILNGRNLVLIIISIIMLVFFIILFFKAGIKARNKKIALTLLLAGIFSNLIDRIFYGYVIDFIKIPLWPYFNIANSCIVTGAIFLFIILLMEAKK